MVRIGGMWMRGLRTTCLAMMLSVILAMAAVATATPADLPEDAAATVAEAHARAAAAASEFAADKAGGRDDDKTTGLARAAEVSSSWRFTREDQPGNGNGRGLGQGRAQAVHEALANGESPSSLDSHGEAVSAAAHEMRDAFEGMKNKPDGPPSRGKGKDKDKDKDKERGAEDS